MTPASARGGRAHRSDGRMLREVNDLRVLNCLRKHQPISSIGVARALGMEPATASRVIRRLGEAGFIRKGAVCKSGPQGGRRPRLLHLRERARLVIGVDVAWTAARGVLIDLGGNVLHRVTREAAGSEEAAVRVVEELTARLSARERGRLAGIGVGAVDAVYADGVMCCPGEREIPITRTLSSEFHVEALVDENTNAFALAEKYFGHGQGASSFCCVWYRHAVGHAMVINGNLFRGAQNSFGEVRHYLLPGDTRNRPEDPGSAVEVRPQAIVGVAERMAGTAGPFLGAAITARDPEKVIDAVARGIEAGDPPTMGAVEEISRAMSVGISWLADLLDPEVLIVGGPVTRWGTATLKSLRRHVGEMTAKTSTRKGPPRLEFTRLGDDVIAMGGAALVMERLFERVRIAVAP